MGRWVGGGGQYYFKILWIIVHIICENVHPQIPRTANILELLLIFTLALNLTFHGFNVEFSHRCHFNFSQNYYKLNKMINLEL